MPTTSREKTKEEINKAHREILTQIEIETKQKQDESINKD